MTDTTAPAVRRFAAEKFCYECGETINAKAEICPKCGVRQPYIPEMGPPPSQGLGGDGRNRYIAALLAIFLGGFGLHKFYLGQTGRGIIYLLLCWTFIPMVVGLIEGVYYLSMSARDFDRKYNA